MEEELALSARVLTEPFAAASPKVTNRWDRSHDWKTGEDIFGDEITLGDVDNGLTAGETLQIAGGPGSISFRAVQLRNFRHLRQHSSWHCHVNFEW